MSNRKILKEIAKENGISLAELKHEMQVALDYAYQNPANSVAIKTYQNCVPRKGKVPTPEEFLSFVSGEMKKG